MALVLDTDFYKDGATGDIYYRDSTGKLVAVGGVRANGNIITDQTGGVPLWAAPAAAPYTIDSPPANPSASDDEFSSTQSGSVVTPTGWTGVNWSGLTVSDVNFSKPGCLFVQNPNNAPSNFTQRHILKALPAGDFTIVCGVLHSGKQPSGASTRIAGLALTDGTTGGAGNQAICTLTVNTTGLRRSVNRYTNFNSTSAGAVVTETDGLANDRYIRIRRSGTNFSFAWGPDLRTWYKPAATTLPFTPTFMGLMVRNDDSTGDVQDAAFDFFRYAASTTAVFGWGVP